MTSGTEGALQVLGGALQAGTQLSAHSQAGHSQCLRSGVDFHGLLVGLHTLLHFLSCLGNLLAGIHGAGPNGSFNFLGACRRMQRCQTGATQSIKRAS